MSPEALPERTLLDRAIATGTVLGMDTTLTLPDPPAGPTPPPELTGARQRIAWYKEHPDALRAALADPEAERSVPVRVVYQGECPGEAV